MKRQEIARSLKPFLLEFLVYAVLVTVYYALVLHLLGNRLYQIYQQDKRFYSFLALGLIVGQGFLLETLTRLLLNWITPRREEG